MGRPLKPRPGYFTRYGAIAFVDIEGRGPVLKLPFFNQRWYSLDTSHCTAILQRFQPEQIYK